MIRFVLGFELFRISAKDCRPDSGVDIATWRRMRISFHIHISKAYKMGSKKEGEKKRNVQLISISGFTKCGNRAGIYDCLISDLSFDTLRRMRIYTSPSCRLSLFCFEFWPSHLSKNRVVVNIRRVQEKKNVFFFFSLWK